MKLIAAAASRTVYRIFAMNIIGLCLFAVPTHYSLAQTSVSPHQVKNIVLVHGAWTDASSWEKVIPLLTAKGYHVTAVHLAFTTLADDAATVKRAIASQDGPTLLVGHSYGGVVITQAGDDLKVRGLVYVAAFAPDLGQSAGQLQGSFPPTSGIKEVHADANGYVS